MANNISLVVGADTSGFNRSINSAKDVLKKYANESKKAGAEIRKNASVSNDQVNAYQRVVNQLNKVAQGTMSTTQQQKALTNQIRELKIQWANLNDEAKKSDFGRSISASLSSAEKQLKTLSTQLEQTSTKMAKVGKNTNVKGLNLNGLKGSLGEVSTAMNALGVQGGSILSTVSNMGSALVNPYTACAAAIGGATYALIDYNKTLDEQVNKTAKFLGLSGDTAIGVRNAIKSIADTYNTDFNDALSMVDQLTKQFGIDAKTATDLISVGMAGGANETGNMASMISQFSGVFADAGVSAQQFVGIMAQTQSGIFSEQGLSVISKAQQRLTEMSSSTAQALQAVGINATDMGNKLNSGAMSGFDAIKQVSQAINKLSPDTQAYANVVKNVFGKVGVQAGSEMIKMLADMDVSIDGIINSMTEEERATYELQKADQELENALASLFGTSKSGFGSMTTMLKTEVYNALTKVINGFIDLYNKSTLIRGGIAAIALNFKQAWAVIKAVCRQFAISLEGIADTMEALINLDFDGVAKSVEKTVEATKDSFANLGKELATNVADAFKQVKGGKIEHVKVSADIDEVNPPKTKPHLGGSSSGGGSKGGGKSSGGTTKTDKPEYQEGSLGKLDEQISEVEKKIKLAVDDESRKKLTQELNELRERKSEIELKLKPQVPQGSLQDIERQISQKQQDLKLAVSDESRAEIQAQIDELTKQKEGIELKLKPEIPHDSLQYVQQQLTEANAKLNVTVVESPEFKEIAKKIRELTEKEHEIKLKMESGQLTDAEVKAKALDERITKTTDVLNAFGDGFSSVGSAIGGTEGQMLSLAGTVTSSIAQMIPQIMSLFAAQEAQAVAGATASGAAQPFPLNLIAIASGLTAVIAAFAKIGSFANGGMIQGSMVGDMNLARVNGGEMILNGTQQKHLFNLINNGGSVGNGNGAPTTTTVKIKGSDLYLALKNYGKSSPNSKVL